MKSRLLAGLGILAVLAAGAGPREGPMPTIVPEGTDRPPKAEEADALVRQIAQRAKDSPGIFAAQLDDQLLQMLKDEPVPQIGRMQGLAAEDRDLLTALLDGLSNLRNTVRADNNLLPSRKIRPILDLADRLRSQTELSIPTAALCSRVDGFGVYEPIEPTSPARFAAGKEHSFVLYCEVENFSSQFNEKKRWETQLTQAVMLYSQTGLAVWPARSVPTGVSDESRSRRRDFFTTRRITLPADLTVGQYLLKVSIVDRQVNRVAEATLPIQIVKE